MMSRHSLFAALVAVLLTRTEAWVTTHHHRHILSVPPCLPSRRSSCRSLRSSSPIALFSSTTASEQQETPANTDDTTAELSSPPVLPQSSTALSLPSFDSSWSEDSMTKVINSALLVVCFGYAAYTIFNIDAGMTRGWTQTEIAMRIPLDNWSSYERALAEQPIYTKTLINVVIYLLGDWLSQTVFQKKHVLDFEASRTLKNGFIGLCFGPLVHEYYQFSDHILPVDGPLINRLEKILMDQTLYLSIKASVYVAAVSLLSGNTWQQSQENVKDKIGGICVTAWKFWPLIHCITYGLVPARHRILWVNCVDLVWNAILASMSRDEGGAAGTAEQEEDLLLVKENEPAQQQETVLFANSTSTPPSGNGTVAFAH